MLKSIRAKFSFSFFSILLLMMLVPACSIDLSQNAAATPQPQVNSSALPKMNIPVTWASLNLTGRLVFPILDRQTSSTSIKLLDLKSGNISTIFQAEQNAWVYFSSASPDGKQLVISYSPPPSGSTPKNPLLYILPIDGSAPPKLLFTPPTDLDQYNHPVWSPDGKYVYFFHITLTPASQGQQQVAGVGIERAAYPDGKPEKIVDSAFWPRVSNDSTRLVYVSINPADGKNKLFVSNMDGSNAQEVAISNKGAPDIIDAPLFSADGQSILFSAITPAQPASASWLEKLLGISVASAHTVPSDWWSAPVSGGAANQLTHIQTTGLYASISPDSNYIASTSGMGLFVMRPDGAGLTMLMDTAIGDFSTVSWLP